MICCNKEGNYLKHLMQMSTSGSPGYFYFVKEETEDSAHFGKKLQVGAGSQV